ncbi:MAG: sensor domain-containing diguanylate cyclase [bacterium]
MKLFLDRNKTLLPRIDIIYLLTRCMILLGIVWFAVVADYAVASATLMWTIAGTFALHLIVFFAAVKERFDLKLAYLSAIIYDMVMIPMLILNSGGVESSFYLLFYLSVSVAAYVLTFPFAVSVMVSATVLYLVSIKLAITPENVYDVTLRVSFLVVYFLAISYSSQHLRRSEKRLLKLFDTLNRRTSELEKSQAQLQMIYENSRNLAAILDTEGIVRELVRLLRYLLQLSSYAVIFRQKDGSYIYRVRFDQGKLVSLGQPVDLERMSIIRKVCEMEEAVRISDISSRDDYQALSEHAKTAMVVPLVSRGMVAGVIAAESSVENHFSQRDLQMLSIVARSAALALENAALHKKTEELTVNDELTQTFNYRYFVGKLDEEKRRASRYDLPLSLVMADIDHFKRLNDTYGHENGNRVLQQLSTIIKSCIRDVDIFARYGGEEFAIILPQTPLAEAWRIGERIRSLVEATDFELDNQQVAKTTVSIGVSSFPENGKSPQQLVNLADQALYRAKGEGRNLVRSI